MERDQGLRTPVGARIDVILDVNTSTPACIETIS